MKVFCFCVLFFALSTYSQDTFSILFYNCENAFDTLITSKENPDSAFTPTGIKAWNKYRYRKKIAQISRVILQANSPDIIGLAEIEHFEIVSDIANQLNYHSNYYRVQHFDSQDFRGIDVAQLFQEHKLKIDSSEIIRNTKFRTRDILVTYCTIRGKSCCFITCHWPSKRGGELKSEHKRLEIASLLIRKINSIQADLIVVMGDFNASPNSPSIQLLKSETQLIHPHEMHQFRGTHAYQGHWDHLDQFLFKASSSIKIVEFQVLEFSYLFDKHKNPFRTYLGPYYLGGFSDHLPISLKIIFF